MEELRTEKGLGLAAKDFSDSLTGEAVNPTKSMLIKKMSYFDSKPFICEILVL